MVSARHKSGKITNSSRREKPYYIGGKLRAASSEESCLITKSKSALKCGQRVPTIMETTFDLMWLPRLLVLTVSVTGGLCGLYFGWYQWDHNKIHLSASIAEFNVYRPPFLDLEALRTEIGHESILYQMLIDEYEDEEKVKESLNMIIGWVDSRLDSIYQYGDVYTRIHIHNNSKRPISNVELIGGEDIFVGRAIMEKGGLSKPTPVKFLNRLVVGDLDANQVVVVHLFEGLKRSISTLNLSVQHEQGIGVISYDAPMPSPFIKENSGTWWYLAHWEIVSWVFIFNFFIFLAYFTGRSQSSKSEQEQVRGAGLGSGELVGVKSPVNGSKPRIRIRAGSEWKP